MIVGANAELVVGLIGEYDIIAKLSFYTFIVVSSIMIVVYWIFQESCPCFIIQGITFCWIYYTAFNIQHLRVYKCKWFYCKWRAWATGSDMEGLMDKKPSDIHWELTMQQYWKWLETPYRWIATEKPSQSGLLLNS